MAPQIYWPEIALRLALTVLAGGLLGWERTKSGHTAGLRTTLLVALAASVAMIQMNLLMETNGKPPNSFAVMDLMRLPLGILTGVGFIGAGAIIRKNEMVLGVTTAATMWFATVVGLCLGGGQLALGMVAAVIGFVVLWGFRWFEKRMEHHLRAELRITVSQDRFSAQQLRQRLEAARFLIKSFSFTDHISDGIRKFDCEVLWPAERGAAYFPEILAELEELPGIVGLEWKSIASPSN